MFEQHIQTQHKQTERTPLGRGAWIILGLLVTVAILIRIPAVAGTGWFELPLVQLWVFPFVFWLIARLVVHEISVPPVVMAAIAVCAALAVGFSYANFSDAKENFVVARFQGDEIEADSRVFREIINNMLRRRGESPVRAVRHPGSPASAKNVARFLRGNKDLMGIVWGGKRWLNVNFDADVVSLFPEQGLDSWKELLGISPVPHVPVIGFSYAPRDESAAFVGHLFAGIAELQSLNPLRDPERAMEAEAKLNDAVAILARWTSTHHRAFPLWLIGNLHLATGLWEGRYERGEVHCAEKYYTAALNLIGRGHPELAAAILNNRAFAYYVRWAVERKKVFRNKARKDFRRAASTLKLKDPFGFGFRAGKIAKSNLMVVKGKAEKTGSGEAERKRTRRNAQRAKQ